METRGKFFHYIIKYSKVLILYITLYHTYPLYHASVIASCRRFEQKIMKVFKNILFLMNASTQQQIFFYFSHNLSLKLVAVILLVTLECDIKDK